MTPWRRRVARRARELWAWAAGPRDARRLPRLVDYLRATPYLSYQGWLGHANLGDELMFLAATELFSPVPVVAGPRAVPPELRARARLLGGSWLGAGVVLGGGTLIGCPGEEHLDALRVAADAGVPSFVFGTGVRDPAFWGDRHPAGRSDPWRRDRLASAARVTVRGPHSAALVAALGLPRPRVVGDLALATCHPREDRAPTGVIGLNLGAHDRIWGDPERLFDAARGAAETLLARGHRVAFVPLHPIDVALGERLDAALCHPGFARWPLETRSPRRLVARIGTLDALVGQRLHAAVLGMGSAVPTLALAYNPKGLDLAASFERPDDALRTDEATAAIIVERLDALLGDRAAVTRDLADRARAFVSLQRREARAILAAAGVTAPTPPRVRAPAR